MGDGVVDPGLTVVGIVGEITMPEPDCGVDRVEGTHDPPHEKFWRVRAL
jgi:hypothetical protein